MLLALDSEPGEALTHCLGFGGGDGFRGLEALKAEG
jgi:hypothetical protein